MRLILVSALVALLPAALVAQSPRADLILTNAHVIVGDSQGTVVQAIALQGSRVLATGTAEAVRRHAGPSTRVVDLGGRTVTPGLVDAHIHLVGGPTVVGDTGMQTFMQQSLPRTLQAYLRHGVTTVRATGDPIPHVVAVRDRINRGELQAPRLIVTGPAVTSPGGHPAGTICRNSPQCQQETPQLTSTAHAKRVVGELADAKVDQVKIVVDSILGPIRFAQLPESVVKAVIDEAHARRLRVIAHVLEAATMPWLARLGVDEFIHMPQRFVSTEATEAIAKLLVEHRIPVTTTTTIFETFTDSAGTRRTSLGTPIFPAITQLLEGQRAATRIFDRAGVRFVVGTDCCAAGERLGDPNALPGARTLFEMETLARTGLSPSRILSAATREAAAALGIGTEVGTLIAGKAADLVIVDGDPLTDVSAFRRIVAVIRNGRLVHGEIPASRTDSPQGSKRRLN